MKQKKIQIGLLGTGRLGKIYARSLSALIPETRLVAVSDTDPKALGEVADLFDVPRRHSDPSALIKDPEVQAVVIATPTDTHRELVEAAAGCDKPIFCEKPLSISLDAALAMKRVVERTGVFFQMGFMRRFDRGYAAAKRKIAEGAIGRPVVFKSTSRDPYRPSLEYLNPASSGGLFVDMGIHDFDLALWFFGTIEKVSAIGGVLAYPEMEPIGDVDNGVASLTFADGRLGVVDLSRNGVYGYHISTEILGTEGTLQIGYLRETPITVLKENNVSHDTVPYFPERFGEAYTTQLRDFAQNLLNDAPPPITIDDGIEALRVALAAARSCQSGEAVEVAGARG